MKRDSLQDSAHTPMYNPNVLSLNIILIFLYPLIFKITWLHVFFIKGFLPQGYRRLKYILYQIQNTNTNTIIIGRLNGVRMNSSTNNNKFSDENSISFAFRKCLDNTIKRSSVLIINKIKHENHFSAMQIETEKEINSLNSLFYLSVKSTQTCPISEIFVLYKGVVHCSDWHC